MKISKHAVSPAVNRIYSSTFTACVCVSVCSIYFFLFWNIKLNLLIVPVFCFRNKSERAKLHSEKDVQSGEHGFAPDHHQIGRNQWTSLRRIRIQSSQLSRICTQAKCFERPRHTVRTHCYTHTSIISGFPLCVCACAFPPSTHEPSLIRPSEAQKLI